MTGFGKSVPAVCSAEAFADQRCYAVEAGIIESNPAHGIRKKDNVRKRRLSEAEYRTHTTKTA